MKAKKNIMWELINSIPRIIFWKTVDFKYLGANEKFIEIIGLKSVDQLIGKKDDDLSCSNKYKKYFNQYDREIVLHGKPILAIQSTLSISDNESLKISINKYPIYDDNHKIIGILGISSDASGENYNNQVYLENIIERIPYFIFWKNIDSVYLGCNQKFAELVGRKSPQEILGKTDFDLRWGRGESELYTSGDKKVMHGNPLINVEEIIARPDGSHIVMLVSKVPLLDKSGSCVGILGISTDITERKKMEEDLRIAKEKAEEATHAKSVFLSIASHEIKGPLANTISILDLMKRSIEGQTFVLNDWAELIDAEIKDAMRGIETINYLLEFLTLDLPPIQLGIESKVNIRQHLIGMIDPFEKNNSKNIAFHLAADVKVPASLKFNRSVDKVFNILLSNAVKYSKSEGEITVEVSINETDTKNYLLITVKDNGCGINKDVLSSFFSPLLADIKNNAHKLYVAPAIKLSYAKKLIELLGGNLEINSQENEGTTVSFSFPFDEPEFDTKIPTDFQQHAKKKKPVFYRKLKILIVEDNPVTARLLESEIHRLGHDVDVAFNAVDAEILAKKKEYDLIFMDISLPGIDGVELKKRLSKPHSDRPIIIAVTSHDNEKDKAYLLQQGFVTLFGKPFTREDVESCIEAVQRVLFDLEQE
ncbi:MAG TPA: PAS domain-containing protein [Gammaproteobacteria bacterium]|jgi:PAS domain S-box-containing protein|nr:PAS domain-containing protein [Gammaproteobacteria bacterium]